VQLRKDPSEVTALALVNAAREQRRGVVQTKEQYVYVSRAIESMKGAMGSDAGAAGAM
jgi:protein tyrosine phosphatase